MSAVGHVGGAASPTSSWTSEAASRPLSSDSILRIEISLSSRRSTAVVMRCTARLYSLETRQPTQNSGNKGDSEWKAVAYGVPCIQITRESLEPNSPFDIKIVIAELESGLGLWFCQLTPDCKYHAMLNNFHTLTAEGKPHAIQFTIDSEAVRFLERVQDILYQKYQADSSKTKSDESLFKKVKKKLTKRDISAPCNFKHVSGITLQRTRTCEDELRGTMQRTVRSMSLSSATGRKKQPTQEAEVNKASTIERIPPKKVNATDSGSMASKPTRNSKTNRSFRKRFGSLRQKKKTHTSVTVTELSGDDSPSNDSAGKFLRHSDGRRSLPTRGHKYRPPVNSSTFIPFGEDSRPISPTRPLSQSSGNLATSGRAQSQDQLPRSQPQPIATSSAAQEDKPQARLTRRHTMSSQSRDSEGSRSYGYSYTPYSKSVEGNFRKRSTTDLQANQSSVTSATPTHVNQNQSFKQIGRQYSSDMNLSKSPPLDLDKRCEAWDNGRGVGSQNRSGSQELQQFHTLGRNFRLSGGLSHKDQMPATVEEGKVAPVRVEAQADEGYVHLYKAQSLQAVGVAPPTVPTGSIINGPTNSASTFAQTIPHITEVTSTHANNWNQQNGRASMTGTVQSSNKRPVSFISDTQNSYYKSELQNPKPTLSNEFSILNPPIRSSKPVVVAAPIVPPASHGFRPQQVQTAGSPERHLKPAPETIAGRMDYSKYSQVPSRNQTTAQPIHHQSNPQTSNSHSKFQYKKTVSSEDFGSSIPVQVAVPVVPHSYTEPASSAPNYKFTSTSNGIVASSNPPSLYNSMPQSVAKQDEVSRSSVNNSFDSNDPDMQAYTEQMSKALEQFSLLTKRPSIIQTSF